MDIQECKKMLLKVPAQDTYYVRKILHEILIWIEEQENNKANEALMEQLRKLNDY